LASVGRKAQAWITCATKIGLAEASPILDHPQSGPPFLKKITVTFSTAEWAELRSLMDLSKAPPSAADCLYWDSLIPHPLC
jgi:hypothetical protein